MTKVLGFKPYQTAELIARVQDVCREKGYTTRETLSACVVAGITYNYKRDLSVLDKASVTEDLANYAPVLDMSFF